jgi:hypothetical protein
MNLYSRGAHVVGRERLPWVRTSRGARRGGANASGAQTWGANGRGGAWGRERGGVNGRGARGARGARGTWGANGGGATTAMGRLRARPPLKAHTGRAQPRATWFVGARTYTPSNGGAHISSEEGINGVTLLISRCQVFSSLLLA